MGGEGRWNREGAGVVERSTEMLTDSAYSVQVGVEQMLFFRDVAVSIAGFRLKSKLLGAHYIGIRQASYGRPVPLHPQLPER